MTVSHSALRRCSCLRLLLRKKGISRAFFFNSSERPNPNFVYLTGVKDVNGCVVIDEETRLFASPLEIGIARRHSFIKNVRELDESFKDLYAEGSQIGVDFSYISHTKAIELEKKKWALVDVGRFVEEMRAHKDEDEVDRIRRACIITAKIYDELSAHMHSLKTESACEKFVLKLMTDIGVQPSFPPIIASSANSVNIHHRPENSRLDGLTIVDLGVVYRGYGSDMTRMFYVGKKMQRQIELFNLVAVAQNACRAMVREGVDFCKINEHAFATLGKEMVHTVGHGLGIQEHELPFVRRDEAALLKAGMVITIEPGLYLRGVGGARIEDVLLVTKKGSRLLSPYQRDIVFV